MSEIFMNVQSIKIFLRVLYNSIMKKTHDTNSSFDNNGLRFEYCTTLDQLDAELVPPSL